MKIISLYGINQFRFGIEIRCVFTSGNIRVFKYSDTSANEDNSFRDHIR